MYNHFKMIEKEFNIRNHINIDKIKLVRDKKLSFNSLNFHEKQILTYSRSYIQLPYNTKQEKIVSYYNIEFNEASITDILKINIIEDNNSGYFFHSIKSRNSDADKEIKFEHIIKNILNEDQAIFEFESVGYSEHQDIAYVIDPKRKENFYFRH